MRREEWRPVQRRRADAAVRHHKTSTHPMQFVHYKDREYGVFAVQRANQRWDGVYELRTRHPAPPRVRRFIVASMFGFDSKLSAMHDAERNARADIDHGLGRDPRAGD
ncbi:hypothetical protein [Burkholderia sp. Z1]|nr:hypothetical protein [Burkholderia sp. Z1]